MPCCRCYLLPGTSVITVTAEDGGGAKAVCTVNVWESKDELEQERAKWQSKLGSQRIGNLTAPDATKIPEELSPGNGGTGTNGSTSNDAAQGNSPQATASTSNGAAWAYKLVKGNEDWHKSPNCYAYVLKLDHARNPGGIELDWSKKHSVDEVISFVKQDLGSANVRVLDKYNSSISSDEYRIAVSTRTTKNNKIYDYHFMLQHNGGSWSGKHGYKQDSKHYSLMKNPGAAGWRIIAWGLSYVGSKVKILAIKKSAINNPDL